MERTRLADIAPRLAKARDQRVAQETKERALRRWLRDRIDDEQRNLAHRELQLARSYRTRDRRYMAERARKVGASRQRVADLQARLDALEMTALHNDPGMDHWINRPRPDRSLRP